MSLKHTFPASRLLSKLALSSAFALIAALSELVLIKVTFRYNRKKVRRQPFPADLFKQDEVEWRLARLLLLRFLKAISQALSVMFFMTGDF